MSEQRLPLTLVVAMAKNRVIGKAGGMPWHLPEDLKHFQKVTTGHAIIMGRKTFDSIGRPLKKRHNIVVSRNRELEIEGCDVVSSIEEAISLARSRGDDHPRVIGGSSIYAAALPLATHIWLTEVDAEPEGDTFFPELDGQEWEERSRTPGAGVSYVHLARRAG